MTALIKILRCPHCDKPMDKALLQKRGLYKAFIARKTFACPHCEAAIKLPEGAETLTSVGIFVAVILAPLFHFWEISGVNPLYVFGIGLALLLFGLWSQKLIKAPTTEP